MLSGISLTQKDKYCRYHLHMESQKYNKLVNKTENSRLMDTDNKPVVSSGEREEGRVEGKRALNQESGEIQLQI